MSAFAPNAHLASAVVNWGPYYIQSIEELKNGTWATKRITAARVIAAKLRNEYGVEIREQGVMKWLSLPTY